MAEQGPEFVDSLTEHFQRGADELVSMAACLLKVQEDPGLYVAIREHIEKAAEELVAAEGLTQQGQEKLHAEGLRLKALKDQLTKEEEERNRNLSSLQSNQGALARLLQETKRQYDKVAGKKKATEEKWKKTEAEIERLRSQRKVALWSMLLPFWGTTIDFPLPMKAKFLPQAPAPKHTPLPWQPFKPLNIDSGAVVAVRAHAALRKVEETAVSTRKRFHQLKAKEEDYAGKMEKYTKQLEEGDKRVRENQKRGGSIEEEKVRLDFSHNMAWSMQDMLKHCFHFVGLLAAKVKVAEASSRQICVYGVLRSQLDDISRHFLPLLGEGNPEDWGLGILSTPEIESAIQKLRSFCEPQIFLRN